MGPGPRIELVDHSELSIARQLHAVQMMAYAQEAKLLGTIYFPPLERTAEGVRAARESFLAAFIGNELVGAASGWPDPEGMGIDNECGLTDASTRRSSWASSQPSCR